MIDPVHDPFVRHVRFDVAGVPATQGSKKAFANKKTGKPIIVDDNPVPLRRWRDAIGEEARRAQVEQLGGEPLPRGVPVAVSLAFRLPKPGSAPKTRRTWPVGARSDLDKLVRAVLDALTGVLYVDDGQVVKLGAGKDYPGPSGWLGVRVLVREEP